MTLSNNYGMPEDRGILFSSFYLVLIANKQSRDMTQPWYTNIEHHGQNSFF